MSANESEIGSPAARLREAAKQCSIVWDDVEDSDQRVRLERYRTGLENLADELEEV